MSEPREWHLVFDDSEERGWICAGQVVPQHVGQEVVHVIEYSALTQARNERETAVNAVVRLERVIEQLDNLIICMLDKFSYVYPSVHFGFSEAWKNAKSGLTYKRELEDLENYHDEKIQALEAENEKLVSRNQMLSDLTSSQGIRDMQQIDEIDALKAKAKKYREALEIANRKLTEIHDMFYGQNLEVANWHQNGTTEPIDSFFEENDWNPEIEALKESAE